MIAVTGMLLPMPNNTATGFLRRGAKFNNIEACLKVSYLCVSDSFRDGAAYPRHLR